MQSHWWAVAQHTFLSQAFHKQGQAGMYVYPPNQDIPVPASDPLLTSSEMASPLPVF